MGVTERGHGMRIEERGERQVERREERGKRILIVWKNDNASSPHGGVHKSSTYIHAYMHT